MTAKTNIRMMAEITDALQRIEGRRLMNHFDHPSITVYATADNPRMVMYEMISNAVFPFHEL